MIAPRAQSPRFAALASWISTLARLVVGLTLLAAGALKVIDLQSSVVSVQAYEILPAGIAQFLGWVLPFVEVGLGLLLIAGLFTRPVAAVSGVLALVFTAAVISVAARGMSIDCGCFGGGGPVAPGDTHYTFEIIRDFGLATLCGWLVRHPRSRFALDHPPTVPTL
ncbi:MAG: DoxX family membrane protein [Microlunatus sp.]